MNAGILRTGLTVLLVWLCTVPANAVKPPVAGGRAPWTMRLDGSGDEHLTDMARDAAGNLYLVGSFDSANLAAEVFAQAEGAGEVWGLKQRLRGVPSAGGSDVFVAKLSPGGALEWVRTAGGSADDAASGVVADDEGNVFVCGTYGDGAVFGGTRLEPPGEIAGIEVAEGKFSFGANLFVAMLNPAGVWQWARPFETEMDYRAGEVDETYRWNFTPEQASADAADPRVPGYWQATEDRFGEGKGDGVTNGTGMSWGWYEFDKNNPSLVGDPARTITDLDETQSGDRRFSSNSNMLRDAERGNRQWVVRGIPEGRYEIEIGGGWFPNNWKKNVLHFEVQGVSRPAVSPPEEHPYAVIRWRDGNAVEVGEDNRLILRPGRENLEPKISYLVAKRVEDVAGPVTPIQGGIAMGAEPGALAIDGEGNLFLRGWVVNYLQPPPSTPGGWSLWMRGPGGESGDAFKVRTPTVGEDRATFVAQLKRTGHGGPGGDSRDPSQWEWGWLRGLTDAEPPEGREESTATGPIEVDPDGQVVVSGVWGGDLLGPGGRQASLFSEGFVMRLAGASGRPLVLSKIRTVGSGIFLGAAGLTIGADGTAYVAGHGVNLDLGTLLFSGSQGDVQVTRTFQPLANPMSSFVAAVDGAGNWEWVGNPGPAAVGTVVDAVVVAPGGGVLVSGSQTSFGFLVDGAFRYYRFTPTRLREADADSVQVADFRFNSTAGLALPSGVSNPGGSNPPGQGAEQVLDGNVATKWLDFNKGGLVFDFGQVVPLRSYGWVTGDDRPGRDPMAWRFEGSHDGQNWVLVDQRTIHGVPAHRGFLVRPNQSSAFLSRVVPDGAGGGTVGEHVMPRPQTYSENDTVHSHRFRGVGLNVTDCGTVMWLLSAGSTRGSHVPETVNLPYLRTGDASSVNAEEAVLHSGGLLFALDLKLEPLPELCQAPTYYVGQEVAPPTGVYLDGDGRPLQPEIVEGGGQGGDWSRYLHWDPLSRRLLAVSPVIAEVRWKLNPDLLDPERLGMVTEVRWPEDGEVFQKHVTGGGIDGGGPRVALEREGGGVTFSALLFSEGDASEIVGVKEFSRAVDGWSTLLYHEGEGVSTGQGEARVIAVRSRVLRPEDVAGAGQAVTIGEAIDGGAFGHYAPDGSNGFVYYRRAPIDAHGADAIYSSADRRGAIVPVNTSSAVDPEDDLVVVWYSRASAGPEVGGTMAIPWPTRPVRYVPTWPAGAEVIAISSGLGSDAGGQGALDPSEYQSPRVYHQPDRELPGFNPNEEHALIRPTQNRENAGSPALFALRHDLNVPGPEPGAAGEAVTSQPYVLLKYRDPQDGLVWKLKPYAVRLDHVYANGESYRLSDFGGTAGVRVEAPYPLGVLGGSALTRGRGEPFWRSYKGEVIPRSAGEMVVNYYYELQPDFYWERNDDREVPWLDLVSAAEAPGNGTPPGEPVDIRYRIGWPAGAPELALGETFTRASGGLPDVRNFASAELVFDENEPRLGHIDEAVAAGAEVENASVRLLEFTATHKVGLDVALNGSFIEAGGAEALEVRLAEGGTYEFVGLPPHLKPRVRFAPANRTLGFRGVLDDAAVPPLRLPNIMSKRERGELYAFNGGGAEQSTGTRWDEAVRALFLLTRDPEGVGSDPTGGRVLAGFRRATVVVSAEALLREYAGTSAPPLMEEEAFRRALALVGVEPGSVVYETREVTVPVRGSGGLAVTAGLGAKVREADGNRIAWVTLAENNDPELPGLPVSLHVFKVVKPAVKGSVVMLAPDNVFDERVTLRHSADFGGDPDRFEFEWWFHPAEGPDPPAGLPGSGQWGLIARGEGLNQVTLGESGTSIDLLGDGYVYCRYRYLGAAGSSHFPDDYPARYAGDVDAAKVAENRPRFVPGWIKRVMTALNPFESRVKDFRDGPAQTYTSLVQQAGTRYEGPVAFNPSADNLNGLGLIPLYESLLRRGGDLSINSGGGPGVTTPAVNNALLLAATRLSDFYMLLGNDAYADALDPTIGFTTPDGAEFGSLAPSVFAFHNQLDSLLEEELALLRGRDGTAGGGVRTAPSFNRLKWNFTGGLEGEPTYVTNYGVTDQNADGFVRIDDARTQFPQGHGDAWGHYLSATKAYYRLLRHPNFTWEAETEVADVGGEAVEVDYDAEQKFVRAAAARAKAGVEIVDLTYRKEYVADPAGQWQGYKDGDKGRAWGVDGWARRVAQGAVFDWAVGNAILPEEAAAEDGEAIRSVGINAGGDAVVAAPGFVYGVDGFWSGENVSTHVASGAIGGTTEGEVFGTGRSGDVLRYAVPVVDAKYRVSLLFAHPGVSEVGEHALVFDVEIEGTSRLEGFDLAASVGTLHAVSRSYTVLVQDGVLDIELRGDASLGLRAYLSGIRIEPVGLDLRPLRRIDRTTTDALLDLPVLIEELAGTIDAVDQGLNPLGVAGDAVPFDINPAQVTSTSIAGPKTHFEQVYDRAEKAVANARDVFDYANQLTQRLRRGQVTADEFAQESLERELELKNRLIEIFGYPYAGDIGGGGAYPDGYDGPDLYKFMYVDVAEVSDATVPEPSTSISNTFQGLEFESVSTPQPTIPGAISAVRGLVFPADVPDPDAVTDYFEREIEFPVIRPDEGGASGWAFQATQGMGRRRAPGRLQDAIRQMIVAEVDLKLATIDYENHVAKINGKARTVEAQFAKRAGEIEVRNEEFLALQTLAAMQFTFKKVKDWASAKEKSVREKSKALTESIPKNQLFGLASGGDMFASVRGALRVAGEVTAEVLKSSALIAGTSGDATALVAKQIPSLANSAIDVSKFEFAAQGWVSEIAALLREEPQYRLRIFAAARVLDAAEGEYLKALAEGQRVLEERLVYRRSVAGAIQLNRYQDITFRNFRNDALQKYRAAFDLAAQYVYLSAKAYDYETNLSALNTASGRRFLTDIVRERSLGQFIDGRPVPGVNGLSDPMARMSQNFEVFKRQLGFDNPQVETGRFSLRHELFRQREGSDALWRETLQRHRVEDLWAVPEFRRFCRPFAPESAGPQPGLVVPFASNVTFGLNYFGWPLAGGDSSYDSSNFATKIRSVGVWFEGYDGTGLGVTPRVYLVPAGADVLRSPDDDSLKARYFRILDQRIPEPFPIGNTDFQNPDWIPRHDSTGGGMVEIRRFPRFRAYHDGGFSTGEMLRDSRLVGRSVWNTRWLLIIPGGTFLSDADEGLEAFISGRVAPGGTGRDGNGITDIKIFFETYGYSGF